MNAKSLLAALSLAVAGSAAFAGEATEFAVPASTLSRADVKVGVAKHDGNVVQYGEATVFADAPAALRSREEVRAEARAAARHPSFNELYAG
jgi:hypothetical protein